MNDRQAGAEAVTAAKPPFSTIEHWLDRILATALIAIFSVLVVVVVTQVTSRYVFNNPTTSTEEIARFLFIWLSLIGAAYAAGGSKHLSIDILPILVSGQTKRGLLLLLQLLILGFACAVMIYGGWSLAARTLANGQVTPTLGLPMGWIYMAIPISGAIIAFYAVIHFIRIWMNVPVTRRRMEDGSPLPADEAERPSVEEEYR